MLHMLPIIVIGRSTSCLIGQRHRAVIGTTGEEWLSRDESER
jgi:hypothetical protein